MIKDKGFEKWLAVKEVNYEIPIIYNEIEEYIEFYDLPVSLQWGLWLEYIREERGVLIYVYRNASGYLWSMEKNDGGTDLGWSEYEGNCEASGSFTSYDRAMEHAITLELSRGLEAFQKDTPSKEFHWGNYALYLILKSKKK